MCCLAIPTMSGLASSAFGEPVGSSQRTLTFAERVVYQQIIEDVYWRHRIWPEGSPTLKPSLNTVISQSQIETKVADYLRKSQALEDYWQRPIAPEQLQAELDRMAKNTKQPEILRELFEALGNDPLVIAECLARPALAERLLADWFAYDERIHGDLKQRAEGELLTHPTVEKIKQSNANYSEIELVKADSSEQDPAYNIEHGVKLNNREWNETVQKLAAMFDNIGIANSSRFGLRRLGVPMKDTDIPFESSASVTEAYGNLATGKLSPLQENEECYYATAIIEKSDGRMRLARVIWAKEPLESWVPRVETETHTQAEAASFAYTLPVIPDLTCTVNTWAATSMNAPRGRFNPTAVWTGSEMIVWGGYEFGSQVLFKSGGRYNPSTDTWIAIRDSNAPEARIHHTAVWTGTEMIVWGGNVEDHSLKTGGRYNPTTNSWTATSTINAPYYRSHHTAVWTGTEMIIWGGSDGYVFFNTGGRYNPNTNSWITTSTTNAPQGRYVHTAVWTGRRMVVWGGNGGPTYFDNLNTGGRYDPAINAWTATSTVNAPEGRWLHTAVWTGSEMIVWGGNTGFSRYFNTGGRYNPATNNWSATTTVNAPLRRDSQSAIWTGREMIVWGGFAGNNDTRTGGRYNPATNSWTATAMSNSPSPREAHTAIWTGSEMIVWGGGGDGFFGLSTGGRYNPTTNSWATTNGNAPTARSGHTAVWTGLEMIIWGGQETNVVYYGNEKNTGERFMPSTDTWTGIANLSAPSPRQHHTAIWTGTRMIVWGGYFHDQNGDHFLNNGGRYDPATNSWAPISTTNAPTGRDLHTAIWTGSEMIVWGGYSNFYLNTGGRYNPNTNNWVATTLTNAPSERYHHTAVWSGSEMIVWGGGMYDTQFFNTGGRYNPSTNAWASTSTSNAPSARQSHTTVWTGTQMIIWGGNVWDGTRGYSLNTGSRYDPATNSWAATSPTNAPTARTSHAAVWTGTKMVVWGGNDGNNLNTGGRYSPSTDSWAGTSMFNAPAARRVPTAVWTGSEMIVWGGLFYLATDTGGRYCEQ
jgi:N-acetylneuraminic acid mutarotase